MAAKKATVTKEIPFKHRDDAEWLTTEICNEYRNKAIQLGSNNIAGINELKRELEEKCDITELEALNILNGYHAAEYVIKYNRMKNHVQIEVVDPDYLEWLHQKEVEEQKNVLGDFNIEED